MSDGEASRRCQPCEVAKEKGWWGESLPPHHTHCHTCHDTMPMTQVWGHCVGCHTTFRGERVFNDHHEANLCSPSRSLTMQEWKHGGKRYERKHDDKLGLTYYGTA